MRDHAVTAEPEKDLGLYVHIPFCVRKCGYCDFLSFPSDAETRGAYTKALIRELAFRGREMTGRSLTSVFLGGGTPTVLEGAFLKEIFEAVRGSFEIADDAEITIEMNPGTDRGELDDILTCFVNRVSLGLQSFDDTELKTLGRIHTAAGFLKTFEHLKQLGIANINVDVMSSLPGQTPESFLRTLENVTALKPAHISAYSLILEDGTPFAERYTAGRAPLPDEETEAEIDRLKESVLAGEGYRRYEISNYAREGYECRHNKRYWTGGNYLGVGLGAASLIDGTRFRVTPDLKHYLEVLKSPAVRDDDLLEERRHLSEKELMEEFLFLGLRLTEGIDTGRFEKRFGCPIGRVYGDVIERHLSAGLIKTTKRGIALTERGIEISNLVLADYLID